MLSIAISTFFAFALFGSAMVIAMMFRQYHGRIVSILQSELGGHRAGTVLPSRTYRQRAVKAPQLMTQNRSTQPVPLRAAA